MTYRTGAKDGLLHECTVKKVLFYFYILHPFDSSECIIKALREQECERCSIPEMFNSFLVDCTALSYTIPYGFLNYNLRLEHHLASSG